MQGESHQARILLCMQYMARDLSSHMSLQGPGSIGPAHSHHHMASVPSDPTGSATPTHTPAPQSSENTMPREMSAEMDGPTSQQLMSESSFLMSEPGVSIGPDEDGSPAAPNSTGAQGSAGQSWHAQQTGTTAGFASNPSAAVAGPGLRVSIGQQPMSPLEGVEGPAAGLPPTAIGAAGYQTNMQLSPGAGLIAPSPGRRLSESLFRSLTVGLNVSTPSGLGGWGCCRASRAPAWDALAVPAARAATATGALVCVLVRVCGAQPCCQCSVSGVHVSQCWRSFMQCAAQLHSTWFAWCVQ